MKLAALWKDNVNTEDLGFDYDTRVSETEDTDSGNAAEVGCDLVDSVTGSILDFHQPSLHTSLAHSDNCGHEQDFSPGDELIDDDGSNAFSDTDLAFSPPATCQTSPPLYHCDSPSVLTADQLDTMIDDTFSDVSSGQLFTSPLPFRSRTNSQVADYPGYLGACSHTDQHLSDQTTNQGPELIMDDDFSDIMSDLLFTPAQSHPTSPRIASTFHHLLDFDFEDFDSEFEGDDIGCIADTLREGNIWCGQVEKIGDVATSGLLASPVPSASSSLSFGSEVEFTL